MVKLRAYARLFDTGSVSLGPSIYYYRPGMYGKHPHAKDWQAALNEHWPAEPRAFKTHSPGIRVSVRVVWERDGEEWLPGVATRWDPEHVYVEVLNTRGRLRGQGVWVKPADVRRVP